MVQLLPERGVNADVRDANGHSKTNSNPSGIPQNRGVVVRFWRARPGGHRRGVIRCSIGVRFVLPYH